MLTAETLAIVAFAFLVAGFVKGVVGLGLPVISIAILATTIGLKNAVPLFLIPALATNAWQSLAGNHFRALLIRLWPLFAGAVIGIWIGVRILAYADAQWLSLVLGSLLVAYTLTGLTGARLPKPGHREAWLTPVMGTAGGVLFGMTGNFLLPGVLYVQSLGLSRDAFVQALGMTFMVISVTLVLALSRYSLMSKETAFVSALALVPTMIGVFVGQRVRKKLSEVQFRLIVLIAVGLAGVYMIVRAVISGMH
jgi:uncharacterized membrane protein YfcA